MTRDDADRKREGTMPKDPAEGGVELDENGEEKRPLRRIGDTLEEALRRAEARMNGAERPLPLPWPQVAEQFGGGLWPGLHVFVGGTGSGKTQWCIQAGVHAARAGFPVAYVGLELEELQIALRMLSEAEWKDDGHEQWPLRWSRLYTGKAKSRELERAHQATHELGKLPIYIEEGKPGGWPVSELGKLAERMREAHPQKQRGELPMLIVLDFLQIVGDEPNEKTDLRERIGRAAYFARDVARRLDVAVLLVSSAARDRYGLLAGDADGAGLWRLEKTEEKNGKTTKKVFRGIARPDTLVGLGKESGEIEYSADSVTVAIKVGKQRAAKGEVEAPTDFTEEADAPKLEQGKKREERPKTIVCIATAKGRATGAGWCDLLFDGTRFFASNDDGTEAAERMKGGGDEKKGPKTKGEKTKEKAGADGVEFE